MNLTEMVSLQVNLFDSNAHSVRLSGILESINASDNASDKVALYNAAIEVQRSIINATYNYNVDRREVGGPTPTYVFVKSIRTELRKQRDAINGKSNNANAIALRARFDALLNQR